MKITRRQFLKLGIGLGIVAAGALAGDYFITQPSQTSDILVVENFDDASVEENVVKKVNIKITPSQPQTRDGIVYPRFGIVSDSMNQQNRALAIDLIAGTYFDMEFTRERKDYEYFSYFRQSYGDLIFFTYINGKFPQDIANIYNGSNNKQIFELYVGRYEPLDIRLRVQASRDATSAIDNLLLSKNPNAQTF